MKNRIETNENDVFNWPPVDRWFVSNRTLRGSTGPDRTKRTISIDKSRFHENNYETVNISTRRIVRSDRD